MTPEALAALHRRCFTDAPPPWSARDFAALLAQPGVLLLTADAGFALSRIAADEAELLTLAVHPDHRRQGLGRRLLADTEATLRDRGVRTLFLDVADTNAAARALYHQASYSEVGRRPAYYGETSAIVLQKLLRPATPAGG
ncbi:MAG: GNAT family N-acetyltransferase [Pseudomonadota bacterium]